MHGFKLFSKDCLPLSSPAMRSGTLTAPMDVVEAIDRGYRGLCEYCGEFKDLDKVGRCTTPDTDEPQYCYSCGDPADFSSSQAKKGSHARCHECVESGRNQRWAPFKDRAANGDPAELVTAVEHLNEELVMTLLAEGAAPDQPRQLIIRGADHPRLQWRAAYFADGTPVPEDCARQPTTPLKMAVFRLSDAMLEEEAQLRLVRIAAALIEHGASREPAKHLYESRYGPASTDDEPANAFTQMYELLAA